MINVQSVNSAPLCLQHVANNFSLALSLLYTRRHARTHARVHTQRKMYLNVGLGDGFKAKLDERLPEQIVRGQRYSLQQTAIRKRVV